MINNLKKNVFLTLALISFFYFFTFLNAVEASCPSGTLPPQSAPILLSAEPGPNSIKLTWKEAEDPVTYYLLAYDTRQGSFSYGNPYIGGKSTTSYIVDHLENGVTYYFRVRAGNGCRPGKFSRTFSATPGVFVVKKVTKPVNLTLYRSDSVLGVATSARTPTKTPTPSKLKKTLISSTSLGCSSCNGLPLLGAEALALVVFFAITRLNKNFTSKSILAVAIPLFSYLFFLKQTAGTCTTDSFTCKYFLLLNLIVFILISMFQRQLAIKHHDYEHQYN